MIRVVVMVILVMVQKIDVKLWLVVRYLLSKVLLFVILLFIVVMMLSRVLYVLGFLIVVWSMIRYSGIIGFDMFWMRWLMNNIGIFVVSVVIIQLIVIMRSMLIRMWWCLIRLFSCGRNRVNSVVVVKNMVWVDVILVVVVWSLCFMVISVGFSMLVFSWNVRYVVRRVIIRGIILVLV